MVLPSEGSSPQEKTVFDTQLEKCIAALTRNHPGHYMVHNISKLGLTAEMFHGSFVSLGAASNFSAGHHAPAVAVLQSLGRAVQSWLHSDPSHVAVLLADPEQAALVAVVVAAHCGMLPKDPERLGAEYASTVEELAKTNDRCRRFKSHAFFLRHWCGASAASGSKPPVAPGTSAAMLPLPPVPSAQSTAARGWVLEAVEMTGVPRVEGEVCRPFVMVIQDERVLFSGLTARGGVKGVGASETRVDFPVNVPVTGDLILRLYHLPVGRPGIQLCSIAFHTHFVAPAARLPITLADMDEHAQYPRRFPSDFRLELRFGATVSPPSVPVSPQGSTGAEVASTPRSLGSPGVSRPSVTPIRIRVEERVEHPDTSNDEAVARALQEQFEREFAAASATPAVVATESAAASPLPPLRMGAPMHSTRPLPAIGTASSPSEGAVSGDVEERSVLQNEGGSSSESADDSAAATTAAATAADDGAVGLLGSAAPASAALSAAEQLRADEEFARMLQEQLDSESREAARQARRDTRDGEPRRGHRRDRERERERSERRERGERGEHRERGERASGHSARQPEGERHHSGHGHRNHRREQPNPHPHPHFTLSSSEDESASGMAERLETLLLLEQILGGRSSHVTRLVQETQHVRRLHLSTLPVGKVTDVTTMADKECQVCLSGYAHGDTFKTLPCLHFYHADCIDPWLETNTNCPVCQTRVDASLDMSAFS